MRRGPYFKGRLDRGRGGEGVVNHSAWHWGTGLYTARREAAYFLLSTVKSISVQWFFYCMEVRLPNLGEGAEAGTVVSILVKEGDHITKGQTILELENEKAVGP